VKTKRYCASLPTLIPP